MAAAETPLQSPAVNETIGPRKAGRTASGASDTEHGARLLVDAKYMRIAQVRGAQECQRYAALERVRAG